VADRGQAVLVDVPDVKTCDYAVVPWTPLTASATPAVPVADVKTCGYAVVPWTPLIASAISVGADPGWQISLKLNGGAATTVKNRVTLTISAKCKGATPAQMAFSTDGSTWGAWVPYATTYQLTLPPQDTYPVQQRNVWARFKL
jgi:hypothetical protein